MLIMPIEITQQDQLILENNNIYSEKGLSTLITRPLNSEEPVSIIITINGIGSSENPEEWLGPQGGNCYVYSSTGIWNNGNNFTRHYNYDGDYSWFKK